MLILTTEMTAFLAAGVAHQVGGCTPQGRPCLCRALAAQVEADSRLLVLISGESGFEVLDAIRATRRVAVNFTSPANYRSLHLKGEDAEVSAAGGRYRELLDSRHAAFRANLVPLGFPPEYTSAWYSVPDDDLVAIHFTPLIAFNQTPGPGAGNILALHRAGNNDA